eukprot:9877280-Heterocapsa_arctica.AAC.1
MRHEGDLTPPLQALGAWRNRTPDIPQVGGQLLVHTPHGPGSLRHPPATELHDDGPEPCLQGGAGIV